MNFTHAEWRKSTFSSETADCIEIAHHPEPPTIAIRDSKNPTGGVLCTGLPAWAAFRAMCSDLA